MPGRIPPAAAGGAGPGAEARPGLAGRGRGDAIATVRGDGAVRPVAVATAGRRPAAHPGGPARSGTAARGPRRPGEAVAGRPAAGPQGAVGEGDGRGAAEADRPLAPRRTR